MTLDDIIQVNNINDPVWEKITLLFTDMYTFMEGRGLMLGLEENGAEKWIKSVKKGLGRFGVLYISAIGDEVTGFAHGSIRLTPDYLGNRKIGVITHIHLKEDHRRKGTGRLLVKALEEWFVANDVHSVELQVVNENIPAKTFWEKLGYRQELVQYRKVKNNL